MRQVEEMNPAPNIASTANSIKLRVAPHERSRRLLSPNKKVASMRIGLDIDGLLDEQPDFFSFLSHALRAAGHFVAVLTYRDPDSLSRTKGQLAAWGIEYDELHFARSLSDKGRLCRELKIDVYFDDQDECLVGVDETTTVFKIRNGGNFDFAGGKWLSTSKLTRLL